MNMHVLPTQAAITAIAGLLASHDPSALEHLVSTAIDALDALDGDPEAEANGDDEDPKADRDRLDVAWPEWSPGPAGKMFSRDREMPRTAGPGVFEDDEAGGDDDRSDCD